MSADHIHPPLVAGIYGRKADGARSVVLAGEFDDEDNGDTLYVVLQCLCSFRMFTSLFSFGSTYIGSGGREPGVCHTTVLYSGVHVGLTRS